MKKYFVQKLGTAASCFALTIAIGCTDWDDHLEKKTILEEASPNDPANTGLSVSCPPIPETALIFSPATLNTDLPSSFDLSPLMPPVRSQGRQGSCVAWATGYYLKSYQEKVQFGYDYNDFSSVMSPAYLYNQIKIPGDCSVGSCIENALYVLKTQGITTWLQFPYLDSCSTIPTTQQMSAAAVNQIAQGYVISSETEINGLARPQYQIIKDLVSQGIPAIIAMSIDDSFVATAPRNGENLYIYKNYDFNQHYGNHAMLIVGYDDALNAFKVVNSWGSAWANGGYCWISYDFFRLPSDPNLKAGNLGVYVAYDE